MDRAAIDALTPNQRAVLTFYLDTLSRSSGVQICRAGIQGEIGGRFFPRREHVIAQLVLPTTGGSSLHFYGTLGDAAAESGKVVDHEHQFVVTFDEESPDIVAMLSYARLHHDLASALTAHSSFLLAEDSPMRTRGYSNVLVTRADLFGPFRDRNSAVLNNTPTQIFGLIPLEPREWQIKVDRGTDALFDDFQSRGRDLLKLRPRSVR